MTDTRKDLDQTLSGQDGSENPDRDEELLSKQNLDDISVAPGDPEDADKRKTHDVEQADEEDLEDAPRSDENLEEGIEDSMDASDPPSSTQP